MSEYKLVPVEPADEMVSAAEDAYMPFGDMEMAIRMAVLAAPAVQGEAVAITDADILAIAGRVESCPVSPWWLKDDVAVGDVRAAVLRFARALLGAAPQPAEQQPAPDVAGLEEAPINVIYTDGCGAGRRSPADCRYGVRYVTVADTVYWPLSADDAQRLRSAECGRGDFTGPANECPDVSALVEEPVEALELARIDLKEWLKSFPNASREPTGKIIERIDSALAAHRKQGGE